MYSASVNSSLHSQRYPLAAFAALPSRCTRSVTLSLHSQRYHLAAFAALPSRCIRSVTLMTNAISEAPASPGVTRQSPARTNGFLARSDCPAARQTVGSALQRLLHRRRRGCRTDRAHHLWRRGQEGFYL